MARLALVKPVAAFLDLIAQSEGTSTSKATHDDGYDIIVSGVNGHNSFADYSAHPFAAGRPAIVVRTAPTLLESRPAGATKSSCRRGSISQPPANSARSARKIKT